MRSALLALGALAFLGVPAQAEIASYYGKELAGRLHLARGSILAP